MQNPLSRKLSAFVDLSADDRVELDRLARDARRLPAGSDLIQEGDRPENVFLLLEGWACRYKLLDGGRRQIMAYLLPGDLCDIHIFILKQMDHAIALLSNAKVVAIRKSVMEQVLADRPAISQALLWAALVDEAVLREWLVNIGQRNSYSRLAHLFCELWIRMDQVGLVTGDHFTLPLTQQELGDTIGLSTVHVNRTLQRLRSEGLISLSGKQLTIHDIDGLKQAADFDQKYLHLDRRL